LQPWTTSSWRAGEKKAYLHKRKAALKKGMPNREGKPSRENSPIFYLEEAKRKAHHSTWAEKKEDSKKGEKRLGGGILLLPEGAKERKIRN